MEALDLMETEIAALEEKRAIQASKNKKAKTSDTQEIVSKNPTFMGLSPYKYFARCLREIKAPDLEQALLVLPFHYVSRLVPILLKVTDSLTPSTSCSYFKTYCRPWTFLLLSLVLRHFPVSWCVFVSMRECVCMRAMISVTHFQPSS